MSNFGVRDLTAALKAFRTAQASADGIPPYRVFTNKELEAIVKARPTSVAAVQSIPGFGPAKTSKYGEDIAAAVCASSETASPVPAPAPAVKARADLWSGYRRLWGLCFLFWRVMRWLKGLSI